MNFGNQNGLGDKNFKLLISILYLFVYIHISIYYILLKYFVRFIEASNSEMQWVIREILNAGNDTTKQAKIINHFIKIAKTCKDFKN